MVRVRSNTVVCRSDFQHAPTLETWSDEVLSGSRGAGSGVGIRHDVEDGVLIGISERVQCDSTTSPERFHIGLKVQSERTHSWSSQREPTANPVGESPLLVKSERAHSWSSRSELLIGLLTGRNTVVWRSTFQYAPTLETWSEEVLSGSRGAGSGRGVRHDGNSTVSVEQVHSECRESSRSDCRAGLV